MHVGPNSLNDSERKASSPVMCNLCVDESSESFWVLTDPCIFHPEPHQCFMEKAKELQEEVTELEETAKEDKKISEEVRSHRQGSVENEGFCGKQPSAGRATNTSATPGGDIQAASGVKGTVRTV